MNSRVLLMIVALTAGVSQASMAQTDLYEDITSDRTLGLSGSPYRLLGTITVRGCKLTIQSGVTVDVSGGSLVISAEKQDGSAATGQLDASGAKFAGTTGSGTGIVFTGMTWNSANYFAQGTLNQCTFQNTSVICNYLSRPTISNSTFSRPDNSWTAVMVYGKSTPTLSGNTISGFDVPFLIADGGLPVITGNTISGCVFKGVALGGDFYDDYVLPNFGLPFRLEYSLAIHGCSFTFPSGASVDLRGNPIYVSSYAFSGDHLPARATLNATNVTFIGPSSQQSSISFNGYSYDYIDYYAEGTLNGCTFQNVRLDCQDLSRPTVSSSTFTAVSNDGSAIVTTDRSTPAITGTTVSGFYQAVLIQNEAKPSISGNNFTGCVFKGVGLAGSFRNDYTLSNYGYPFRLYYALSIEGCSFTIPSGATVEMQWNPIYIQAYQSSYSAHEAKLLATNVTFTGDNAQSAYIYFWGVNYNYEDFLAGGTLDHCTFQNVWIDCENLSNPAITASTLSAVSKTGNAIVVTDRSTPTITGSTISGYHLPFLIQNEGKPSLSGNTVSGCVFKGIGVAGSFRNDYTLADYGYPYQLYYSLSIEGCTFTIAPGLSIDMQSGCIYVQAYESYYAVRPAKLLATNVTFSGANALSACIYFWGYNYNYEDYLAGGSLAGCTFHNTWVDCENLSNPTIANSTFSAVGNQGSAIVVSDRSTPSITGNTIGGYDEPFLIQNEGKPVISGNTVTGCVFKGVGFWGTITNDYAMADYGYPYRLYSTLSVEGCTLTIPPGLTINLQGNCIYTQAYHNGYTVQEAKLFATNVTFTGTPAHGASLNFWGYTYDYADRYAGGTLNGCTLQNVQINCWDLSNPAISNSMFTSTTGYDAAISVWDRCSPTIAGNTISGYALPFRLVGTAQPSITGNTVTGCTFKGIGIYGNYYQDHTVANFGYPYRLESSMYVSGASLTFASGLSVDLGDNSISVIGSVDGSARLDAANVVFSGNSGALPRIYFEGTTVYLIGVHMASGTLSGCVFQGPIVECRQYADPQFSNCAFSYGEYGLLVSDGNPTVHYSDFLMLGQYGIKNEGGTVIDATNNFWGDASGPQHSTNPSGLGVTVSDGVTFKPFSPTKFSTIFGPLALATYKITGKHEELPANLVAPGELVSFQIALKNGSTQMFMIDNVYAVSGTSGVTTEEVDTYHQSVAIPAGATITYPYTVFLKISNWAEVASMNIKFKVVGSFVGSTPTPVILPEVVPITLYRPPANRTLTIPEIIDMLGDKTLAYGDIVATSYYPFFKIDRCEGCSGLEAGAQIVDFWTGYLLKDAITKVIHPIISKLGKNILKYTINSLYEDENKYRYIYTVAGVNHTSDPDVSSNYFLTNSPVDWDIPKVGLPVRVIAKVKKLQDYAVFKDPTPPPDLPLLEPLTFVLDERVPAGYSYLDPYSSPLSQKDRQVITDGVVHQYWQSSHGDYFFSLVQVKESVYDDIPVIGTFLNAFNHRIVIRQICRAPNAASVPEIGSTVRVRGAFRYAGFFNMIPVPDNWTGDDDPQYAIDAVEVTLIAGSMGTLANMEKELFNTDRSKGPIDITLTSTPGTAPTDPAALSSAVASDSLSPADLHLYDGQGRHTGVIYGSGGAITGSEVGIPGSAYMAPDAGTQSVYLSELDTTGFIYKLVQRKAGQGTVSLTLPATGTGFIQEVPLAPAVTFASGTTSQSFVRIKSSDSTSLTIDNLVAKVLPGVDQWSTAWRSSTSMMLDVYIGELSGFAAVEDISGASLRLNWALLPVETAILTSVPGFSGSVLRATFRMADAFALFPDTSSGSLMYTLGFAMKSGAMLRSAFVVSLFTPTDVSSGSLPPGGFALDQNYPNPFNPRAHIGYRIAEFGFVRLAVYDLLGREVAVLVNESKAPGTYDVELDASGFASGVYVCRLTSGVFAATRKMIVMR